ncbi:hypothetical protein PHYPSEUDO_002274 [Phytophthora pseudosyringae]|uniref:Transmembrane protein n=1 Tax=Phytophthora pseudosyringae TaxID=221518 RepID=A0A8T1VTT0_9STRA|nr:hypothetical protein PHYPSEUDO_002274 [Phytophthora pseudosyringae]
MQSTVAVDDAIRTLSVEMAKDKDASSIGKTEAEMEILAHYAHKGRRRAAVGAICGSSAMAGLWKLSKNQRKLAGAFAMMSGGLFGASYGIISIRRDLFSDLLMLPSDKSPFATRARNILMAKIPDNSFVQQLNEKFRHSAAATDSWKEDANAFASFGSKPSTNLDSNVSSSSIPPITGLDTPRGKKDSRDSGDGQDTFGEPNDSGIRSPFQFGAKPPRDDDASESADRDAPLARDPYAHYPRESAPPLRHDEDDYFFGEPSEAEAAAKPTTWEEIRRRAAEQHK